MRRIRQKSRKKMRKKLCQRSQRRYISRRKLPPMINTLLRKKGSKSKFSPPGLVKRPKAAVGISSFSVMARPSPCRKQS